MMLTFYSFKNKNGETLIKRPGEIDGQMFDIADCENSSLAVLDYCEQVQIDEIKNCRVFIGACASSIFIRNCSNCVFYTSCRQLRLRDVVNCSFYIYSMAEVHIEYSSNVRFAPFNGGYPEQAQHLRQANLDASHNLWYDIFDHNDPGRTRVNWSLIPEAEYEQPWFPAGEPCEPAVPRTKAGSVQRVEEPSGGEAGMQSFSVQQLIADAQALAAKPPSPVKSSPPPAPAAEPVAVAAPPLPPAEAPVAAEPVHNASDRAVLSALSAFVGNDETALAESASIILPTGESLAWSGYAAAGTSSVLTRVEDVSVNGNVAWATFVVGSTSASSVQRATAVIAKSEDNWKVVRVQFSAPFAL